MIERDIVQELQNMLDSYQDHPCPRCTLRDALNIIKKIQIKNRKEANFQDRTSKGM